MPNIFQDELESMNQINQIDTQNNEQETTVNLPLSRRKLNKHQNKWLSNLPTGRVELLAVTAVLFMLMWVFGWHLSPINKVNHLTISGNELTNTESILYASGIRRIDSLKNIMAERKDIEHEIKSLNPIVSSVVFERPSWQQLNLSILEYSVVGLVEENDRIYPLLENGEVLDTEMNQITIKHEWSDFPLIVSNEQKGRLVELAIVLKKIDPELLKLLHQIEISEDQNKPNAIEVVMKDGIYVKAITNTFAEKVKHYPQMKAIIGNQKGTINLEVGAYFIPEVANANSVKLDANIDN